MHKDRKKEHKKVVKYMQQFNKRIAEDKYLGLNRFRIDLYSENWYSSGGELRLIFKMSDLLTGNKAWFICDNYDYKHQIAEYLNDFMIRCSSGQAGHYPPLHYAAYDVHTVIPYNNSEWNGKAENGVIEYYNWLDRG